MITTDRLKELFEYNPETGVFTRKVTCGGAVAGSIAGTAHNGEYLRIRVDRQRHLAHRLAWLYMTGAFPKDQIDHINGIGTDNRWINIRSVNQSENQKNKPMPRNNTTGIVGVYWAKRQRRWQVSLRAENRSIHLGFFENIFDAACTRRSAELEHGYHQNSWRKKC